jgi:hypothetical protein
MLGDEYEAMLFYDALCAALAAGDATINIATPHMTFRHAAQHGIAKRQKWSR